MILPAALAKLNQYSHFDHFQKVLDQITAAQGDGLSEFDVDVKLLDEDEISDLVLALDVLGYTTVFNDDTWMIEVSYE